MHDSSKLLIFSEVVRARATSARDRTAFIFLESGERESARLTFSQLHERASVIAAGLQDVTRTGERVLLLYTSGLNFVCALTACLYAGLIAVPAYPPRKNRSTLRLESIVADCAPSIALTDIATLDVMDCHSGYSEALRLTLIATDRELDAQHDQAPKQWKQPALEANTLALLQYTSGSTGTPKGVMISHANILSNMEVIATAGSLDEHAVFVSWLPLFHDMGLFGKVLLPIYLGAQSILMEPAAFVQKPIRWLQAVTKYRATVCAAPDSAFDLCVRKISEDAKANLDLSSWQLAFNGAEPVRAGTVERFSRAFESCGFRKQTMRPVYGMAEATLFVTGQPSQSLALVKDFDADALSQNLIAPSSGGKSQSLVSCGRPWAGHRIRIADPETGAPCSPHQIGEIWVSGGSIGTGYWNRSDESAHTFNARLPNDAAAYLRTGDLGFLEGDDLFVTGRLKDLIIVAGRNHYPQDLERAAESSNVALAPNASAAFSIEVDNEECVVLACEVRREALRHLDVESIAQSIRQALADEHEVELHALVLLSPATALRTSSGKIQRSRIRRAYLEGQGLEIASEWRKPARQQAALASPAHRDRITDWIIERVASLAGISAEKLDPREPFSSYGLGSREAVALSGELQEQLGRSLPPTLLYDFPNIAQLARHLSGAENETESHNRRSSEDGREIAIVGLGCRFPGAQNPEAFWRLLCEGRNAIAPANSRVIGLPATGLLEQIDQFDADFFGINAREAESMDPQQRLLLEVAWETLEHAGISPHSLAGSKTAVIVGISNSDYIRLAQDESADIGPYVATGNALSVAANRISYTLDLRGPSWAVDTACSSSLVAVHQACCSLNRGECDAALAGGANLILAAQLSASFEQVGMLSPDGQCKTFDAAANGYVRGEGVGLVLLKRLADAVKDADTILAVIRGSAINQDGRSNGLTAPNGPAQQVATRSALRDAGVHPRELGFVETHGTGTPLGDPIELNSLMAVLNEGRSAQEACWIGSVKTNIGHLESAAGIAGLIKTVLILQHGEIPPHIHYRSLNPSIVLEGTPFRIPECATRWTSTQGPRIAGVSSFGFGGTNAHVVLEEAPARESELSSAQRPLSVVALSARTPEALQALAAAYCAFIDRHPETCLEDLAFTANAGRMHFSHRAAVVASSLSELRSKLTTIGQGVPSTESPTATARAKETLEFGQKLADLYIQGASIDWAALDRGYARKRLALPTYPFERRRYWLETRESSHPLLGRRMEQQAHLRDTWTWESRLDGPVAAFLGGHRVMGSAVLPYSAYIEMALSAASQVSAENYSTVADLTLHSPLFLRDHEHRTVQTVLSREAGGHLSFAVYHRAGAPSGSATWRICASARIH